MLLIQLTQRRQAYIYNNIHVIIKYIHLTVGQPPNQQGYTYVYQYDTFTLLLSTSEEHHYIHYARKLLKYLVNNKPFNYPYLFLAYVLLYFPLLNTTNHNH